MEEEFIKECVKVMRPLSEALDTLQADKKVNVGYLLPTFVGYLLQIFVEKNGGFDIQIGYLELYSNRNYYQQLN